MSSLPRHDPLIGSLLDGRYQIVGLLGRGGMGNVYVAEDRRLQRKCAIKILHSHLAYDPVHVERFLREARIIAQFKHPNLVDIFVSGEEPSGVVFFAMELLEGEDLDSRLAARDSRPFSVEECCAWAVQVARAVGVVHESGLIHRDLKTSNVFLTRRRGGEQNVKLLDFGIARQEDRSDLTGTGVAVGTPSYMSPEQFKGTDLDRRTDIYSFGVMLYRLLTGRLPFTGDFMQLSAKHRDAMPARPTKIAPEAGISVKLEGVVLKCMAKRPADRYASMQAVEDALIAAMHKEAAVAQSGVKRLIASPEQLHRILPPVGRSVSVPGRGSITLPLSASQTGSIERSTVASRQGTRIHVVVGFSVFGVVIVLLSIAWLLEPSDTMFASPAVGPVEAETRIESPSDDLIDHGALAIVPVIPFALRELPVDHTPVEEILADPSPIASHRQRAAPPRPAGLAVPGEREPIRRVQTKASACRRKFKAVNGLRMTIKYWVGADGKVHGATPSVADELGACLAAAVASVRFGPRLELGKRIEL